MVTRSDAWKTPHQPHFYRSWLHACFWLVVGYDLVLVLTKLSALSWSIQEVTGSFLFSLYLFRFSIIVCVKNAIRNIVWFFIFASLSPFKLSEFSCCRFVFGRNYPEIRKFFTTKPLAKLENLVLVNFIHTSKVHVCNVYAKDATAPFFSFLSHVCQTLNGKLFEIYMADPENLWCVSSDLVWCGPRPPLFT